MNKVHKVVGVWVAFVIAVVVIGLFSINNHATTRHYSGDGKQPESGGPASVSIEGTVQLNNLLLAQQFEDVIQTTNEYIVSDISPGATSATITSTTLNQDGSINYTVQVNIKPQKSFGVTLNKEDEGELLFSVPGSGYTTTLYPYGT